MYGTAAVADDFEAVRATLGIKTLDLWGESYGTYLMQVFVVRHREHVRSMVLSGAYPIDFDPWARDRLAAARRALVLICARARTCRGAAVLRDLAHVAARLRRAPVHVTATLAGHRIPVVLDEGALAQLVYAQGDPELLRRLPRALAAARTHGLHALRRLLIGQLRALAALITDPAASAFFSIAQSFATECHDYPRAFSYTASLAARRDAYDHAIDDLDPRPFRPFSPRGWSRAGFEGTDTCLEWPADPTAGPPLAPDVRLPDVPALVLSGDRTPTRRRPPDARSRGAWRTRHGYGSRTRTTPRRRAARAPSTWRRISSGR
jgi:hypothetical protein